MAHVIFIQYLHNMIQNNGLWHNIINLHFIELGQTTPKNAIYSSSSW